MVGCKLVSTKGQRDPHYWKAKRQGFLARSVYKLEELDKKYQLFKAGQHVLDLGASPGSWTQYALERIGGAGFVLGVDQNPIQVPKEPRMTILQMDALEIKAKELKDKYGVFDVVLSDLAPKTTGVRDLDHFRSKELCNQAFKIACAILKRKGSFVCKMYQGEKSPSFEKELKSHFAFVKIQKPHSSRSHSREIFFIAKDFDCLRG